jgi:hypothetical protein
VVVAVGDVVAVVVVVVVVTFGIPSLVELYCITATSSAS